MFQVTVIDWITTSNYLLPTYKRIIYAFSLSGDLLKHPLGEVDIPDSLAFGLAMGHAKVV